MNTEPETLKRPKVHSSKGRLLKRDKKFSSESDESDPDEPDENSKKSKRPRVSHQSIPAPITVPFVEPDRGK